MSTINKAIFLTLVLSLSVTSVICFSLGNSRIFYGDYAKLGKFPYMAALHRKIEDESGSRFLYKCGASIISEKFIVTAGHCIHKEFKDHPENFHIFVAEDDRSPQNDLYEAKQIYLHENFTFARGSEGVTHIDNDIALIELKTPLKYSENVAPVELDRNFILEDKKAFLSGYGDTEKTNSHANLNYLCLETLNVADCAAAYAVQTNTTLCASPIEGGGACKGDSGSPLVYNNKLIGIATLSPIPCYAEIPAGFTRVSLFVDWIEKTIRNAVLK